jgi:hypothetical protein
MDVADGLLRVVNIIMHVDKTYKCATQPDLNCISVAGNKKHFKTLLFYAQGRKVEKAQNVSKPFCAFCF